MKNIYLTGMMGCGKTSVGRVLAERTGMKLVDTDFVIESDMQMGIPEIFEKYGEEYFRVLESNVLYDLSSMQDLVVSCGGGIILKERNVHIMKESGVIVYINRKIDDILKDIDTADRPLLKDDGSNLREIYEQRKERYAAVCDIEIKGGGEPKDTAARLMMELDL